ncbi:hypothetical protein DL546_003714 [Coniochaeta pulveracea]|uniref:Uncharacterized protein n=1 Tax=Coniochaeta pulveracea TaxID=177199 RepID=A0A420YCN2_9PEZI|nr:hypothetical protein DL546_003714 [Coniochaeta pulveracea]
MPELGLKSYRGVHMRNSFVGSSPMGPPKRYPSVITITDSSSHRSTGYVRRGHERLHAPIPVRRFPDLEGSLTQQAERDEADSVLAQVGMQTSPLTPARQEENDVWRNLAALQSATGSVNSETVQPRISPGMSAYQQHTFPNTARQGKISDYGSTDLSSSDQMSSYASRRLDDVSSIPEGYFGDHRVPNKLVELHSQSQDIINRSPFLRLPCRPSEVVSSQEESNHDLSSRAADSPDQYLAGVHDLALKVVSQHLPLNNEQREESGNFDATLGLDKNRDARSDASKSEQISKDITKAVITTGATTARVSEKDPNDLWYSFVFSDANTDDLHREVLAEAQKDIKTGGGIAETSQSAWGRTISNAATVGQPSVIGTSQMDADLTSVPEACASQTAALGSSMVTRTSDSTFTGSDSEASHGPNHAAPSIYAETAPGHNSPVQVSATETTSINESREPESSDVTSYPASLTVEPPQSVVNPTGTEENFIFAPPKLFVGRLADATADRRRTTNTAMMPLTMARGRRGRPRNKSRDGRLDIRSIPRYEDDPIEDFDELEVETRMQPSLFGSLETE